MEEQGVGHGPYEDWSAVMEALLRGDPEHKQVAFLKLDRLVAGCLMALQAWDHREHWEDLRQIVVMKLVKSYCQGQVRESQAFVSYARTITRNEFYDFLKARKGPAGQEPSAPREEETGEEETAVLVRAAIDRLLEEQRRAIQAVYLEGRTYADAAAATGIPLGSLKRYLRLGLRQLREQLAGILKGE